MSAREGKGTRSLLYLEQHQLTGELSTVLSLRCRTSSSVPLRPCLQGKFLKGSGPGHRDVGTVRIQWSKHDTPHYSWRLKAYGTRFHTFVTSARKKRVLKEVRRYSESRNISGPLCRLSISLRAESKGK